MGDMCNGETPKRPILNKVSDVSRVIATEQWCKKIKIKSPNTFKNEIFISHGNDGKET